MNPDIQQKVRLAAKYICSLYNRNELSDDVEQDLLVMLLANNITNISMRILKRRALSCIMSRKYNDQYMGAKKTRYTIFDIDSEICPVLPEEDYFVIIDDRICIDQLLSHLTDRSKEIIKLWMVGYSQDEIAQMYHRSRTAITKVISKALKQVQERMA